MEKVRLELELLNPYLFLFDDEEECIIKEVFVKMLNDIMNNDIYINIGDNKIKVNLELKNIDENSSCMRTYKMVELSYEIDVDQIWNYKDSCDSHGEKLSAEKQYAIKRLNLITENEKFIMDLIFAINLAYPGMFECGYAKVFINGIENKSSKMERLLVDWSHCYIDYLKNKWPQIHILDFATVWKWLNEKTSYINDGMSKTAIDRALNALSYTLGDRGYEEIFYILIGLEAIYNDNKNVGITEQLKTKTEILLKRPVDFKKKISKFYDNRSEFIHGKMNFPNSYYKYDATKEFEDFYLNKYLETANNAKAILLSTIQEYIIQNANHLEMQVDIKLV